VSPKSYWLVGGSECDGNHDGGRELLSGSIVFGLLGLPGFVCTPGLNLVHSASQKLESGNVRPNCFIDD
jgi:hypothetical protein